MGGHKIGRNDPCPCGSGRKFKKCCLGKVVPSRPKTGCAGSVTDFDHSAAGILDDSPFGSDPEKLLGLLELSATLAMADESAFIPGLADASSQGHLKTQRLNLSDLNEKSVASILDSHVPDFRAKKRIRHRINTYELGPIETSCGLNVKTGDLIVIFDFPDGFTFSCGIDEKGDLFFQTLEASGLDHQEVAITTHFLHAIMTGKELKLSGHWDGLREVLCSRQSGPSSLEGPTVALKRILVFSEYVNGVLLGEDKAKQRKDLDSFPLRRRSWNAMTQTPVLFYEDGTDVYLESTLNFGTERMPAQDEVLFQFSDGKNFFFSELRHHPYAALIDRSIWPCNLDDVEEVKLRLLKPSPSLSGRRRQDNGRWSCDEDETEAYRYVNRLLEKNLQREDPVPLFLVADPEQEAKKHGFVYAYEMAPRKMFFGLPVKAIRFSEADSHIWLDPPYVALIRKKSKTQKARGNPLILSSGFLEYEKKAQTIFQMGFEEEQERFGELAAVFEPSSRKIPSAVQVFQVSCKEGSVLEPDRVNFILEHIFKPEGWFSFQATMSDRVEKGTYEGLRIEVIAEGADPSIQSVIIKARSRYSKMDCHQVHDGVEHTEKPFRKALVHGFGAVFDLPNSDLATPFDPDERRQELALYRHQGLVAALFMLMENLEREGAISQTMDSTAFVALMEAHLHPILLLIITGEKPAQIDHGVNLVGFVSAEFISILKEFLEWLFKRLFEEEQRHWFFASDTQWGYTDIRRAARAKLTFLAHCILAEGTPGRAPKSKTRNIKIPKDPEAFFQAPRAFDQARAFFKEPEHTFFLNGKPIETISPSDLRVHMQLEEHRETDWFELNPEVFFNGKKLDMSQVTDLKSGIPILYRGTYFVIDRDATTPLDWLAYFWHQLQGGHSKSSRTSSKIVDVPRSQFLELFALKTLGIEIIGPPRWQAMADAFERLCRRTEGFDAQETSLLRDLGLPLHAFQKTGVLWMRSLYNLGLGGILGDDMGLGKTIQSIGLLKSLDIEGRLGSCLVIVPTSLIYNWTLEFEKFAPDLPIRVFDPKSKTAPQPDDDRIVLCTYGLLTRHIDLFAPIHWNVVLVDEAQALKNIKAKRTGWIRKLNANSKFCLTGTPMENHYGEFFSLIDLCVPGALGEYRTFMKQYATKANFGPTPEAVTFLRRKTSPLVLRRHKKEILDQLPPKIETCLKMDLEKDQAKIYRDIATSWNLRVKTAIDQKGEAQSQLEMLTALLRLRQVCSCPTIVPEVDYSRTPPKFEVLASKLKIILAQGSSAVIFTNFKKTLERFRELLEDQGLPALCISGEVPRNKRGEILRRFEMDTEAMVLLMTLKTGGVGLNLTKASYVFHVDPWWNPQVEFQATDRVHRMGQEKSVNVYRLIMRETIEEKIQSLKGIKKNAFDSLFLDPGTLEDVSDLQGESSKQAFAHTGLTAEDFKYLLS